MKLNNIVVLQAINNIFFLLQVPAVTSGGKSKASAKARSFRVIEGEQDFINCVDGAGLLDGLLGGETLSVCIKQIFQDKIHK